MLSRPTTSRCSNQRLAGRRKHASPEEQANALANRTTLLLVGAMLSLTLGWPTGMLQAQQPNLPPANDIRQIQDMLEKQSQKLKDPVLPPGHPSDPSILFPPPRPAWREFLDNTPYLAPLLFAAAVAVFICLVIQLIRGILWLVRAFISRLSPPRGRL
jgi:hypothetical protein